MIWWAALPVLGYAGISAWLFSKQRDLIYLPQGTRVDAAQTDFTLARGDVQLHGWVLNPQARNPVIYFGGNAESIQNRREQLGRLLPDHSVYLVSYRGYGASGGAPSEEALFGDALAVFDTVRARHPDEPIAVVGSSLGSGVASYVASRRPVSKLVLVAPFDSLVAVAQAHYPMFPVRWLVKDRFDSAANLHGYEGDALVIRAGRDQVVPPSNTDRLIAAFGKPPRVADLPEADHNTIGGDPGFENALADFLR
ncbi:alpha/beta fold hydrolase [Lysobacter sp. LF1]|uniref:Alpha/beta fold hydrolase n=1 Tax=Lysobacter stagni TaxID=3045172 RepID=A0ABT6XI00_9GAMM|nr:alpha/beta fold hydrolase [Lysobacter sp. LF1]MDI9239788.1 alpha/beta fold hydrolase [Lysobacter sp. LF1]